jgi:hypothetical protein
MQLPPIQGSATVDEFFIYGACDEKYFDDFGIPLINSIKTNTKNQLHLHLFNPRLDQLDFCRDRISFTYEYVDDSEMLITADRWRHPPSENSEERWKYDHTINAMKKNNDKSILERIRKTYFACARFVRLKEILENRDLKCLSIDIDAIVRQPIPNNLLDDKLKLFKIEGVKARFLAGAIYFPSNEESSDLLKKYANHLRDLIEKNDLYWSLDQILLKKVMANKSFSPMPKTLIDWDMRPDSIIWTAKGSRKSLPIFQAELKKYTV